jgi:hypothetical protein
MKNKSRHLISLIIFFILFFPACKPASEERRKQEVQDSVRIDEERRQLIERANRMLENQDGEKQPSDTLDNTR